MVVGVPKLIAAVERGKRMIRQLKDKAKQMKDEAKAKEKEIKTFDNAFYNEILKSTDDAPWLAIFLWTTNCIYSNLNHCLRSLKYTTIHMYCFFLFSFLLLFFYSKLIIIQKGFEIKKTMKI